MWNLKCSNRLIDMRAKQEAHLRHLRTLRTVKPTIDFHQPKKYAFLYDKPKAMVQAEQRRRYIQESNSLLVKRMITVCSDLEGTRNVYFKDSLNSNFMRKKQMKIDQQNRRIVKKLQKAQSNYSQRAMSRSVSTYQKAKSIMASSKMDQHYDFDWANRLQDFGSKAQFVRTRPYSAKK